MHCVLILGGYGFFGQRISATLVRDANMRVVIAGRSLSRARASATALGLDNDQAVQLDATDPGLAQHLQRLGVNTVVHTAGPFQDQDYNVAQAAITAGAHYVDLADGRAFVCGVGQLDAAAKSAGVSVISGASSVPGLSSAVIDQYRGEFSRLGSIRLGIGTGARTPGLAAVQGIFSYCGKPISRLENSEWATTYGWLDLRRRAFPKPIGNRWLGSCDIPDLELFPLRYPGVRTVTFHAGFASDLGHLTVWALAGLVRIGLLRSMRPLAQLLCNTARWIEPLVSDKGAMFVELEGLDQQGSPTIRTWNLVVTNNHGPYVPCGASIALVRKLRDGKLTAGAYPCMGLLTVAEYLEPLQGLELRVLPP